MRIQRFEADRVRILRNLLLQPESRLNLLVGPNASGKTSVLEAICLLSCAQSFRTPRIAEVVHHDCESLWVSAQGETNRHGRLRASLERSAKQAQMRYNGTRLNTASEMAWRIPLCVFTPESHLLVTGGPKDRRRWLDWGLFHVEPGYLTAWSDYHQALKQRNALLRGGAGPAEYETWEAEMVKAGTALLERRSTYTVWLQEELSQVLEELGQDPVDIRFVPGIPEGCTLAETLRAERRKDIELGYTRSGPHRAEVEFRTKGKDARRVFSRGRQKLLAFALTLARALIAVRRGGEAPVVLVDDLSSEFDRVTREKVLEALAARDMQVFLTATEAREVLRSPGGVQAVFHVEHGVVAQG